MKEDIDPQIHVPKELKDKRIKGWKDESRYNRS